MQKLMGDEGWGGGGGLFFSTDPKCLCDYGVQKTNQEAQYLALTIFGLLLIELSPNWQ